MIGKENGMTSWIIVSLELVILTLGFKSCNIVDTILSFFPCLAFSCLRNKVLHKKTNRQIEKSAIPLFEPWDIWFSGKEPPPVGSATLWRRKVNNQTHNSFGWLEWNDWHDQSNTPNPIPCRPAITIQWNLAAIFENLKKNQYRVQVAIFEFDGRIIFEYTLHQTIVLATGMNSMQNIGKSIKNDVLYSE